MSCTATDGTRQLSVIKWIGKDIPSEEIMREESLTKKNLSDIKETTFTSPPSLVMNETKYVNKYSCSFCKKSFKWRSHWKSHERIHTGERPFQCEICGKLFTRSDGLQCHNALHNTKRLNLRLPQDGRYTTHDKVQPNMVRHHQEMQSSLPQCRLCSKECYSIAGLMKHMQKHKGQTNFPCDVCNKMFTKRSALEIHGRVHTGLKPYQCNICTKAFSILGNLKRHLLIHSGERPYKCIICSNSYNNRSHLKRHIKTKHPAVDM